MNPQRGEPPMLVPDAKFATTRVPFTPAGFAGRGALAGVSQVSDQRRGGPADAGGSDEVLERLGPVLSRISDGAAHGSVQVGALEPFCSAVGVEPARGRIFAGVDDAARREILAAAIPKMLAARQVLAAEGDPATTFYLVVVGHLKLSRIAPDGREVIARFIGPAIRSPAWWCSGIRTIRFPRRRSSPRVCSAGLGRSPRIWRRGIPCCARTSSRKSRGT